jgi:hypothetical protein
MGVFAPRKPCPHCGKKVKRPRDPANFLCPHCGNPGPWASAEQVSAWQQQADARARYSEVLAALASGASDDATQLPVLAGRTGLPAEQLALERTRAFASYVQRAAGDDILTPEEEQHVERLLTVLGIDSQAFFASEPELARHVMIAQANGGLPEVVSSRLVQKRGEVVHLEIAASLVKDVAVRQSQGGYSGFSFPIGKTGIRYKVGGYRGQSVEVGTKRVTDDIGTLVISSQRAVFIGNKKTLELPYAKLVNLGVFSDGVQFHESNRVNAPLFLVPAPDVVSVFVHAAALRLEASKG